MIMIVCWEQGWGLILKPNFHVVFEKKSLNSDTLFPLLTDRYEIDCKVLSKMSLEKSNPAFGFAVFLSVLFLTFFLTLSLSLSLSLSLPPSFSFFLFGMMKTDVPPSNR